MTTTDQREQARYRQDVLASYRAWLAFLEAQQTLVDAAAEEQSEIDPFEGQSPAQERAGAARKRIAALQADKRELFEHVFEQHRQAVQRQLDQDAPARGGTVKRSDPDEVTRRAIVHLVQGAKGQLREDGRGLVPRGKPDAVTWLGLDLSDIEQARPSETDYQIAAGGTKSRRGVIINLVFAGLALLAIPVLLFLLQPQKSASSSIQAPVSNGAEVSPWPVTAIAPVAGGWTLPVERTTSRWPEACAAADAARGCWFVGSFRPLELCMPAPRLAELAALRVEAADGKPARTFALSEARTADIDIIVAPCVDGNAEAKPRYGRLLSVVPATDLAPGQPAPAGFQVQSITIRGRGEDPALPKGRMVLSVAVEDRDANRDWVALAPTVLLADGGTTLPSDSERTESGVRFDYLISEQREPFDALWQLSGLEGTVRYRVTLDPPPDRDAVLRAALRVESAVATPSQQTMTVSLTLRNVAKTPLTLLASDIGFQNDAQRLEVAAPALRQPLAPDERRVVVVELPLRRGVLFIGPLRYELVVQ
jgi:hypothetical protein